jgi:iron(III) transport system permease protein
LRRPRLPLVLVVPSALVSAAALLPLAYLVLRASNGGVAVLDILLTPRTFEILLRSLILVAAVTAGAIALGVPLAWITTRTDLVARQIWLVLATLPLVVPTYVGGFVLVVALGPRGMLQRLLEPLGVERLPEIYGFPGAVLILTLHTYPYVLLNARATLVRLDPSLEEASRNLGLNSWTTFRRVVLPQLHPAIASGALLAALYTLGDFGAVSLLNYESFTWAIFVQYQSAFDRTQAAALSLVLVLVAVLFLLVEAQTRPRWHAGRAGVGVGRRVRPIPLRGWRWPAVAVCAVPVVLGVALPIVVLSIWVAQALSSGQQLAFVTRSATNSLVAAILAALVTVVAALAPAVLTVRFPGWASGLLERAAYIGFGLPRIATALGLVFFGAAYAGWLYQTLAILLVAYAILFLPTALGSLATALRQVPIHLEEAAHGLGRSGWSVFTAVTLPIIWPGVLAALALVFLLTMEELPATLILRPAGFDTLASSVWSATSEALFARAAVPALILTVVSGFSLALLYRREEFA